MRRLIALAAAAVLAGCASVRETLPPRSAAEEQLIAHAADRGAAALQLALPAGQRVFVDGAAVPQPDAAYAISAVRAQLLARGSYAAADRASADIIMELRAGALSIDEVDKVVGMPSMNIPWGDGKTVTVPEISAYSTHTRTGAAEFSAFAYDAHTGRPIAAAGPVSGEERVTTRKLLATVSWGKIDLAPPRKRAPN